MDVDIRRNHKTLSFNILYNDNILSKNVLRLEDQGVTLKFDLIKKKKKKKKKKWILHIACVRYHMKAYEIQRIAVKTV